MSSVSTTKEAADRGVKISLAGLVLQVVSLAAFCGLFGDYMIAYTRSKSRPPMSRRLVVFLAFLSLGTMFVLLRCVYRIVELHEGYFSHWFRDETLFIALESAVMVLAVFSLLVGHPGLVFNKGEREKLDTHNALNPESREGGGNNDKPENNAATDGSDTSVKDPAPAAAREKSTLSAMV
ncbi:parasitic phase-specific protein PSP-1 [Colletotrichum nymphaeae SA-01]|uniref:Parasitic phase-specific protein PSP-1 n=1 Tax=Colletotrichum nymphaeae SA-01 TaxID=1460502 RepID=A0A135TLL7_9PEZI|nr:parasitic phase-specific protein PSP-1 [Colletotrichum nymphaeae SA-01]